MDAPAYHGNGGGLDLTAVCVEVICVEVLIAIDVQKCFFGDGGLRICRLQCQQSVERRCMRWVR